MKLYNRPRNAKTLTRAGSEAWWYEEPEGICVIVQVIDSCGRKVSEQVTISKRQLKTYMARVEAE